MTIKVIPRDGAYIVLDTNSRNIIGRHSTKAAAIKHRRHLRGRDRRRK